MVSKIPRHELATVLRLFMFCLLVGSSYTLAKTAAVSLFLSRVGSASLSVEFLAAGLATALFATLWVRAAKKISIDKLMRTTALLMAVCYLCLWWMLPMLHHSFVLLSIVYVMAEVKGCLYAIVAISAMNETLGRNSSRQSWATVLLGFPIAAITVGTAVGFESTLWDADNWLLLAGLLDGLAILPSIKINTQPTSRTDAVHITQTPLNRGQNVGHGDQADGDVARVVDVEGEGDLISTIATQWLPLTKYADAETFARWFSLLIGAKVLVLTLVAFNWKVSVGEYLGTSERLLAAFFGWFYAMSGVGTLLVQFFITGRLLANKSVVVPILVLPTMLLLLNVVFVSGGSIGFGMAALFYISTFAKGMDTWRRSTHDTAIHLLYTSVEKRKRRGLIGHNHGLVKPGGEIVAGIVLVTCSIWVQHAVLIVASLVWLFATLVLIGIIKTRSLTARMKNRLILKGMAVDREHGEGDSLRMKR